MSDFDLLVVGDIDFIVAILNGIAGITNDEGFFTLVKFGFIIGLVIQFFKSLLNDQGQSIKIAPFFISLVLILGLFVPKSNVIVESSTKGEVQTVANVPLAVGLTAGTINGMGQLITNFFETAFAPLGATSIYDEAYLDPLSFITKLNEKDPSLFFEAINDGVAASGVIVADAANDTELTLKNYVRECTRAGVDRGELNASDIESRPLFDPADINNSPLRWPHLVFTTEVRLNIGAGPAIQTLSCLEAWDHVAAILAVIEDADFDAFVGTSLESGLNDVAAAPTGTERTQALMDMVGQSTFSTQNLMRDVIFGPAVEDAFQEGSASDANLINSVALQQARAQRQAEFAAEKTLFEQLIQPITEIITGLTLALSIPAALLIAAGAFNLAWKYTYLLIWVALWPPILAICNLYITVSAQNSIEGLVDVGALTGEMSRGEVYELLNVAKDKISVGAMMAAATPMIALMVLYGSAVTATSLAGRMTGRDAFNEKQVVPDAFNPAPVMATSSGMMAFSNGATKTPEAGAVLWNYNLSNQMSSAASRQQTTMKTEAAQTQEAANWLRGNDATLAEKYEVAQRFQESLRSQGSDDASTLYQQRLDHYSQTSLTDEQAAVAATADVISAGASISGTMGASFGLGKGQDGDNAGKGGKLLGASVGIKADGNIGWNSSSTDTDVQKSSNAVQQGDRDAVSNSIDERRAASLVSDIARAGAESFSFGAAVNETNSQQQSYSQAFTETQQAADAYSETLSAQSLALSSKSGTEALFANTIVEQGRTQEAEQLAMAANPEMYKTWHDSIESTGLAGGNLAKSMAALRTLSETDNWSDFAGLVGRPTDISGTVNSDGLSGPTNNVNTSDLPVSVEANIEGAQSQIGQGRAGMGTEEDVRNDHQASVAEVEATGLDNIATVNDNGNVGINTAEAQRIQGEASRFVDSNNPAGFARDLVNGGASHQDAVKDLVDDVPYIQDLADKVPGPLQNIFSDDDKKEN